MRSLCILILITLSGCGTIHQLGTSDANRAILHGPTNIMIYSVDGNKDLGQPFCAGSICGKGFELGLTPGEHTIILAYSGDVYTNPMPMKYQFESGKHYRLVAEREQRFFRFKIENDEK